MSERASLVDRIEARSTPIPECGCMVWLGRLTPGGYGMIIVDRRKRLVHRIQYEIHNGPIPIGLVIDHKCRVRSCWNPTHLEAVTNRENILRGVGASAKNSIKTTCRRGHPFSEATTGYIKRYDGIERRCRLCHAEESRRFRARKKSKSPPSALVQERERER